MFIVTLTFTAKKSEAGIHMEAHKEWINKGFEDKVFIAVGSIRPGLGGAIVAGNLAAEELQKRVEEDPFVSAGIVIPHITDMEISRTQDNFENLKELGHG